jgi:hypothetical protein
MDAMGCVSYRGSSNSHAHSYVHEESVIALPPILTVKLTEPRILNHGHVIDISSFSWYIS